MKKVLLIIILISASLFGLYKLYNYIHINNIKEEAITSIENVDINKLTNVKYENDVITYANINNDNYNCTYNYETMDCYNKNEIIKFNEDYISDDMKLRVLSSGKAFLTLTKETNTDTLRVEDLNGNIKYILTYNDYINKSYKDNIVYVGYGKFSEKIECKIISWDINDIKYELIYSHDGLIIKQDKVSILGYEVGKIIDNKIMVRDMTFEYKQ